jgi:broad specificity phosphatase PhoE
MKLIFVRHGQTDWNKEKKLMGRTDIELNEEGRAQCQELVQKLESDFYVIFSSPLKRAYETAQVIAEHFGKEVIIKNELTERDFGTLSGKTWIQIQEETGVDMRAITKEERYDFRPYGGESAEDVKARLLKFLEEVKTQPYSKVVIACHSGVISMMRHLFPNNEISPITNTSVHEFELV